MKISVIICCYNSVGKIIPTLNALVVQEYNDFEIILVDNNSNDGTLEFAKNHWENLNSSIPISFVTEKTPGLSSARKKGVLNSRGQYILFCDDDNHLDKYFISKAVENMDGNDRIGALCGKNIPLFKEPINDIVRSNFISYACGHDGIKTGKLPKGIVPWGAGLVIRSSFIKNLFDLEFESLLSDRTGNDLSSGGDTEYCYLIKLMGLDWYYDNEMILKHDLPNERLNFSYLTKLYFGFGRANMIIEWYYKMGKYESLPLILIWWKVFAKQYIFFLKKESDSNPQQELLNKQFRKGYMKQLWAERKNFRSKQIYIQEIIKELKIVEGTSY